MTTGGGGRSRDGWRKVWPAYVLQQHVAERLFDVAPGVMLPQEGVVAAVVDAGWAERAPDRYHVTLRVSAREIVSALVPLLRFRVPASRWRSIPGKTSPSGKQMFRCDGCGGETVCPRSLPCTSFGCRDPS